MAKYAKRKDGRYQANVTVGVDPKTGKYIRKSVYASSIAKLERKKADLLSSVGKGTYADDEGYTLTVWADKWFKSEIAMLGIKTQEMYRRIVYSIITPNIGSIRLKDLRKSDVQELISIYSDRPRTCQQIKMTLNRIIESAIDEGLVYKNVCRQLTLPKYKAKEKRALTNVEKKAIEKADLTLKERVFLTLLEDTGIRRGEILALSKTDIDLKAKELRINNAVTFDAGRPVLKSMPKSTASIRKLPLLDRSISILKRYLKTLDGIYLFEMERKSGLMTHTSYINFWNGIIKKLNDAVGTNGETTPINGLTAHVLRHNYATTLFYSGVDIKEAQYLLGHANVKLTLDTYTHLEKEKTTAREKLNQYRAD